MNCKRSVDTGLLAKEFAILNNLIQVMKENDNCWIGKTDF